VVPRGGMARIDNKSSYFRYLRPRRDRGLYHYFVSVQTCFQHNLPRSTYAPRHIHLDAQSGHLLHRSAFDKDPDGHIFPERDE
jgi:hypothetical protein